MVSDKNLYERCDLTLPLSTASLRRQCPANETRCFDVPKTDITEPISESKWIAIRGFLDNPGTVCISSKTEEYGSARRKVYLSSSDICFSCLSIKSRQIFSFAACFGQIVPSTVACISSIGCLQRLSTKGVTSKVSHGCSRICPMMESMEREDLPKTSENTSSSFEIRNGKTIESTIFHISNLISYLHILW